MKKNAKDKIDEVIKHLESKQVKASFDTPSISNWVQRYERFKLLITKYLDVTQTHGRFNPYYDDLKEDDMLIPEYNYIEPDELRQKTLLFYDGLNDDDKLIFKELYVAYFLDDYVKKFSEPLAKNFDAFKLIYTQIEDGKFWNIEPPHPVFGTESNERFFNYVMGCFKEDGRCYKQKTLSYVFRVMFKTITNSGMYIRYVNEHYGKDLKPIKEKLIGLTRIQEEKVVDEYNQVFKKAQSKWNDENPLYQKNFKGLFYVA